MACDDPFVAFRSDRDPVTRRVSIFLSPHPHAVASIQLPCGKCDGCRLDNARMIALRAMNESSMHSQNCFLTLTYDDEHLPANGSLKPRDLQLFWKRLRIGLGRVGRSGVRYLACGEYGETTFRPHYHAIVFGFYPPDAVLYSTRSSGNLYSSALLDSVWSLGAVRVGAVSPRSVSYVARYTVKKSGTSRVPVDHPTLFREFRTMSRRPGLGRAWYERFKGSDISADSILIDRGIVSPVPRYYLNLLEVDDPIAFDRVKSARNERAAERVLDDPHGVGRPAEIANRNARLNLSRGVL